MARRKKPADKPAVPHEGNMRVLAARKLVANPGFTADHPVSQTNPLKITATVNVRESAIALLVSKGAIDEAQEKAADRFRLLWERMGGAGAGAIDYSRTRVDGGRTAEPITMAQMQAGRDLQIAEAALKKAYGDYAYKIVGYVCGEGYSIHDLTETRRQRDTMTDNLRAYLDVLAALWGFSSKSGEVKRQSLRAS